MFTVDLDYLTNFHVPFSFEYQKAVEGKSHAFYILVSSEPQDIWHKASAQYILRVMATEEVYLLEYILKTSVDRHLPFQGGSTALFLLLGSFASCKCVLDTIPDPMIFLLK